MLGYYRPPLPGLVPRSIGHNAIFHLLRRSVGHVDAISGRYSVAYPSFDNGVLAGLAVEFKEFLVRATIPPRMVGAVTCLASLR